MLNFTVGPVTSNEEVRKIGGEQVPYFRTEEFSKIMIENEHLLKKFINANEGSRVAFITGSGTAAMEAAIMNIFNKEDKLLIINGGSFGQRFVELCMIHEIPYTEIKIKNGSQIQEKKLEEYEGLGYTGMLVNAHETSTGVLYNMSLLGNYCKKNKLFLLVDAISSFLADEFNMHEWNVGATILSSQKALACPPGISMIVLGEEALERIESKEVKSMYFNLKNILKNGERGQTPFTPAVGILIQINSRLKEIEKNDGVKNEIQRVKELANDFRMKIKNLPLEIYSESLSNAVTPLHPKNVSAYDIFLRLKNEYNIWICPNGGNLKDEIFRVGHLGALTKENNMQLIEALIDMNNKNLL